MSLSTTKVYSHNLAWLHKTRSCSPSLSPSQSTPTGDYNKIIFFVYLFHVVCFEHSNKDSGDYFFSCLIAMALKNSKTGSLPVSEIYSFMKEHFPYFKV